MAKPKAIKRLVITGKYKAGDKVVSKVGGRTGVIANVSRDPIYTVQWDDGGIVHVNSTELKRPAMFKRP